MNRGVSATTASPTGTLTRKIHGQLRYEVSTPPSRTPAAPPLPEAAAQTPIARLRPRPSVNVVISSDNPAGAKSAPPRPWTARNAISEPDDQASPERADPATKTSRPIMKRRRRP